jgi:hypothetical protein
MGFSPPLLWININKEAEINKLYFIAVLFTTFYNIAIFNSKPLLLV